MKSVYHCTQYREYLRESCNELKAQPNQQFRYALLARFIEIQATYLSRVLNGSAHLNADQLARACEYFLLNDEETEFLLLLLDWEKSSYPSRKKRLFNKIEALRKTRNGTAAYLKAKILEIDYREKMSKYFLEPFAPVIHAFFSIDRFARNPKLIGIELGLSEQKLKQVLSLLETLGLIVYDDNLKKYTMTQEHLHLDKESDVNESYQKLTRIVSSEFCSRLSNQEKHQYCVSFGATPESYRAVHQEFNQFIAKVEKIVRGSSAQGIYQLNFQLFPWHKKTESEALIENDLRALAAEAP